MATPFDISNQTVQSAALRAMRESGPAPQAQPQAPAGPAAAQQAAAPPTAQGVPGSVAQLLSQAFTALVQNGFSEEDMMAVQQFLSVLQEFASRTVPQGQAPPAGPPGAVTPGGGASVPPGGPPLGAAGPSIG